MYRRLSSLNTIFGRLALLLTALLVSMQVTSLIVVESERDAVQVDNVSRLLGYVQEQADVNPTAMKHTAAAFNLRLIDATDNHAPPGCPRQCSASFGPFADQLRTHLPPHSIVILDSSLGAIWVRYAGTSRWIVVPEVGPPVNRLLSASAFMLVMTVIAALAGAWQIQKPVLRLARATREFRTNHLSPRVKVDGPREVRNLIRDFNAMAGDLSDAERERAVMLAGVAHDLRAPLTRIQVRASIMQDEAVRSSFLHDTESLSQIVTQFLDFARDSDAEPDQPRISVDAFCLSHYADIDHSLFQLDLHAGGGFKLPAIELDRILSNLVENALCYGEPPVVIATRRSASRQQISVRDHGSGICDDDFARALRPFVRIDPARGGDAHCGLGLTIVRRLSRRYGGELSLANAADGGLVVTLDFPM